MSGLWGRRSEDAGTGIFSPSDEERTGTYEDPNLSSRTPAPEPLDARDKEQHGSGAGRGAHQLSEERSEPYPGEGRARGDAETTLHEERLRVGSETAETSRVRVRKEVETRPVEEVVERGVEHAETERVPAAEGDSGEVETLPDGSVSVPVFEEQIVVEKRLVVRERIVIRKHTLVEEHVVQADVRRERVEVEGDEGLLDDRR